MSHFILKCESCDKVTAQCRCFDCNKQVIKKLCEECKQAGKEDKNGKIENR